MCDKNIVLAYPASTQKIGAFVLPQKMTAFNGFTICSRQHTTPRILTPLHEPLATAFAQARNLGPSAGQSIGF
jgi:hypothetical protein